MLHDPATCRLGKGPARHGKLRLATYLKADLPPAPEAVDWTAGVTSWGVMGNDSHGDCVFAAGAHAIQTWTVNAGLPAQVGVERTMSDAAVLSYYSEWAGYVPGDPATDNGFVIADFLNLWKADAYGGVLLDGFVDPDPANQEHIKQAVTLFGGVDIGLQLPTAWQNMSIWDVAEGADGAPGSWGGHSVWVPAYNATGPVCVTWGALKQITWAAWQRYCDEAHAIISPAWMDKNGCAACSVAYSALRADSKAIADPRRSHADAIDK